MDADDVVNLVKDAVVLESECPCRDVVQTFYKSCVSNEQIIGVTERGKDVTVEISFTAALLPEK